MSSREDLIHINIVSIPDTLISTLCGLYDVLNSLVVICSYDNAVPEKSPFHVRIVGEKQGLSESASGVPIATHKSIKRIDHADIVIVPALLVANGEWVQGRYPELVKWLLKMYDQGAILCSTCTGALLLAETGLLDGKDATMHWAYHDTFRQNYPNVNLRLESVLVTAGRRDQLVMAGAAASWHDLALYLIARHVGPKAAQAVAKFMVLSWHSEGQAPYLIFDPPFDHGDSVIQSAQKWLSENYSIAAPVEEVVRESGLAERSFKRRFTKSTGYSPIAYVQYLRVEEAKRQLERTDTPIEEISWTVGYEDQAFFRRLFKRITNITPGAYRKKFRVPEMAAQTTQSQVIH